jgi:phenylacetate-CoA ligase
MAEEISNWSPLFLDLDPVHGVRFALYCEQQGIQFPSLKFILSSYEFTSVVHRKILARVFGMPVFNLYGSTETGHLLMENTSGDMKPAYETAYLEIVEPDAHGIGALVVTTLTNNYMPLLRYRIGDLAQKVEGAYGNSYVIHGRARDALKAHDGQRVTTWQADQCFAETNGIAHYELRQGADGHCTLRYVPDSQPPTDKDLQEATSRLESLLGVEVKTERMNVLVPAASGKFRLTAQVA